MIHRMRFAILALISVMAVALPAQAQKLAISVTDLKITSGLSAAEGEQLTKKLLNELAAIRAYEVLDIAKRDEILNELKFQQAGACDQSSCLVEVGKLLGVNKMAGGSIGKLGNAYSVELQMVDVRTSAVDMPFSRTYTGDVSALLGAMKEAAAEFSKWKPAPKAQAIAPLSVDYGGLVVRSTPLGARIFLDGADVGTTPGQLNKIETGDHQIIITKDGYSSYSQTVKVSKNVAATVSATLTKEYGTLNITSDPINAAVYIDGLNKGLTGSAGLRVAGLGIGAHKIKVTKAGYQAYEVEMTVESGEGNSLNAPLTPKPGSIVITSTPGGAGVTVDGTPRGNTPCSVTGLEPGSYNVKVEKTGYEDGEISVSVGAGQSVARSVVLRKVQTSPRPSPNAFGEGARVGTGKQITNPTDGSVLVEVPAGSFSMGSNDYADEKPVHTVHLDKYYIGKYEVTVGQFKKFCNATGKTMPEQPSWNNRDDHPVVNVTWNDAKAYCDWAGLRLPTEAEWEKAARGPSTGSGQARKYPWGNKWNSSKCNSSENGDSYTNTSPVGSFPSGVSPYGAYDMAGNVWEWCNDWYDGSYYGSSPSSNPTGPSSGSARVLRGGSWNDYDNFCRSSPHYFLNPDIRSLNFGFRPAK